MILWDMTPSNSFDVCLCERNAYVPFLPQILARMATTASAQTPAVSV